MMSLLTDGLFVPVLALALLAWFVPRFIAKGLPEGVKPLMLNAFLSVVVLFGLSSALFTVLYFWQGMTWEELVGLGLVDNLYWFGRLGLSSAIVWAPIMVLSVANLPRRWVSKVW